MKLRTDDPRPKSKQVERAIVAAIAEGEFRPGQAIPSRQELINHFAVSNGTINSAINQLKTDGVLVGAQGAAVYVQVDHVVEEGIDLHAQLERLLAGQTRIDAMVARIARHLGLPVSSD